MRMWSSSLIITQSVSSRFNTSPLPALLAACSRLIRCRSTRICLSSCVRLSMDSEKASFISGRLWTAGRMVSRTLMRSGFFAQPGKAACLMLRASRTRLDITIRSCGPFRRAESAGGIRNWWMSIVSARGDVAQTGAHLFDFIAQQRGLFEIFVLHGFGQFFLQTLQAIGQVPGLAQRFGNFADVACTFVHGFEQALETFSECFVAFGTAEPTRFLEIGVRKAAARAF